MIRTSASIQPRTFPASISFVSFVVFILVACGARLHAADGKGKVDAPNGDAAAPTWVWWEAESPTKTNFNGKGFVASQWPATKEGLSGGDWMTTSTKQGDEPLFAAYDIETPVEATYTFFTRKFYSHGPFRWKFDEQEWTKCGRDISLLDTYELAKSVCANWVNLGTVKLAKGKHALRIELTDVEKGKESLACFDCFLLSAKPFAPSGKLKPGEKSGLHEEGWWAFEPEIDAFHKESPIDLRYLNEKNAGDAGWVKAKGLDFIDGKGKPIKFWGVGWSRTTARQSHAEIDWLAAKMAKSGVNLVRFHENIFDQKSNDPFAIDAAYLDQLHYCIAALKKQGIYVDISWYYVLGYNGNHAAHGLPGYDTLKGGDKGHPTFALMYFDPHMQDMWRAWAKAMMLSPNPYDGLPMAKDPAVMLCEVNNEDNLLFHTLNPDAIPKPYWDELEKKFGAWLAKKYGSLDKAFADFPGQHNGRDDAAKGVAEVMGAWNMSTDGATKYGPDKKKRMENQVQFLAETQRDWFTQARDYFKKDLGYPGLISASNWCTCDDRLYDSVERWTYQVGDVIDRHGYYGKGDMRVGGDFHMMSALLAPQHSSIPLVQEEGFPHIQTEINWIKPNPKTVEMAYLCSTYGALQGMDAWYYFCIGSSFWLAGTSSGPVMVPSVILQPAYALQFRRHDVQEAPTVVHQVLPLEGQFAMQGCTKFGENSDSAAQQKEGQAANGPLDPMTPFVGRITRTVAESAKIAKTDVPKSEDISTYIDRDKKTVTSITHECLLDWGNGVSTVNTPKSQGACGFLAKVGTYALGDVTITSRNEYGAVQVISLDDQPLKTSRRILIQAFTEEKAYGWKFELAKDDADPNRKEYKVTNQGTWPLNIRDIASTVTFKAPFKTATVLDENGDAVSKLPVAGLAIELPAHALFVVIER